MPEELKSNGADFDTAFAANDRQERITTVRVGSVLVFFLMPAGTLLDYFVYGPGSAFGNRVPEFLSLRLACSALVAVLWFLLTKPFGQRHYKPLSLAVPLLPAFFISVMIARTEGPNSPYYAGLNLILLAASVVVHWNLRESLISVVGVLAMYFVACYSQTTSANISVLVNNYYFLVLTGIIVVTGNLIFNRLRFREFAARFELDRNRRALELTNQKLDAQNKELADTLKKLTEAELQLVQQEKMASLGVMSAGIIHEINNPLNYATTGLYTLRQHSKHIPAERRADFDDVLKDVEDGVSRVKTIVSDLRAFSHPETESREEVSVAEVIEQALRFLSGDWLRQVRIERNLEPQLTIHANQNKLVHVALNLLQNSLDALKTKTFTDEAPTIWIEGKTIEGRSRLVIRDNGPGIEKSHLEKIFDPFFTTKDVGQGMGLGLSICYRIVRDYGGQISVRTEAGKFCEFTLEFPAKG